MLKLVTLFCILLASSLTAAPTTEKLSEILYNLLSRSPQYSVTLSSYLENGPQSSKFKELSEKLLLHKDIVDVVEGFYTGQITWTKDGLNEPWKLSYSDQKYKTELEEADTVISALKGTL